MEKPVAEAVDLERLAGQVRDTHEPLEVGDIIRWDEWWGHEPAWAQIIEIEEGMCTTHFRVRFDDAELERINQEDKEWFRCRHLRNAVVYVPNAQGDSQSPAERRDHRQLPQ